MINKNSYIRKLDEAQRYGEIELLLLNFMKEYILLYSKTSNKEHLEMARWIKENKKSTVGECKIIVHE